MFDFDFDIDDVNCGQEVFKIEMSNTKIHSRLNSRNGDIEDTPGYKVTIDRTWDGNMGSEYGVRNWVRMGQNGAENGSENGSEWVRMGQKMGKNGSKNGAESGSCELISLLLSLVP